MDCLRVLNHRCSWHAVPIDFTFASREHRIKRREKLISKLIQEVARRATFFRRIKPRDFIPFIRGVYRALLRARARVYVCVSMRIMSRLYLLYGSFRTKAELYAVATNISA